MTKQTSVKYRDLIQTSQSEIESQEIQFKVSSAHLQLQSDILATKRSISEAQSRALAAKRETPFSSTRIITAQLAVEALEDGLKRLEELKTELF